MKHYLDLHIHSRYSRATSSQLNPQSLAEWGLKKGLALLGTGDLTHPAWLAELNDQLVLGNDGFYGLKSGAFGPRFVPTGEISCIYKQGGATRKIHLLVITPDLEAALKLSEALGRRGNVTADGRPILGLSARDLLEICLTLNPANIIIPAHIWTPWFSLFGSKSGFDDLTECFGDLSGHITALETGLSSDPPMNRLISALDSRVLVSSSDAHSPDKLGREATILEGPLDFNGLSRALAGHGGLAGTVEFFPEEGKYHLDGHANCGPALKPEESASLGRLCPKCGRPLTIGVLSRVRALADRPAPPAGLTPPFHQLVPLMEILGQVLGVGPKSKKVGQAYDKLLRFFQNELTIILSTPLDDIKRVGGDLLALALERVREGRVEAQGGYDGLYGTVTVVRPEELREMGGQRELFETARKPRAARRNPAETGRPGDGPERSPLEASNFETGAFLRQEDPLLDNLDAEQLAAVTAPLAPLAVVAGPGAGKTRVLVRRAAYLLREHGFKPEEILALTFTRKAAEELGQRLESTLPFRGGLRAGTLHGLAFEILSREDGRPPEIISPEQRLRSAREAAKGSGLSPEEFLRLLGKAKSGGRWPAELSPRTNPKGARARDFYEDSLKKDHLLDYDDLIVEALSRLKARAGNPADSTWARVILLDEFQDLSPVQYDLLKTLAPPEKTPCLTVIGDPDQAIYGFRGAQPHIFADFRKDYPQAELMCLSANYRSSELIVKAGEKIMSAGSTVKRPPRLAKTARPSSKIVKAVFNGAKAEAAYVANKIERLLGVLNLGRGGDSESDREAMANLGLADIAVIYRLRSLAKPLAEALAQKGLACQISGEDDLTATDGLDFTADKINLLTMHAAKGLEFKVVFIVGLEEGLTPYLKEVSSPPDQEALAEERRLFYVGLTRAKERLILTRNLKRRLYGAILEKPSPFWGELPAGLCQKEAVRAVGKPKIKQLTLI